MSLLMLVKYPVSNPPSLAQINALPDDLYREWCKRMMMDFDVPRILLAETLNRPLFQNTETITQAYEKLVHLVYMLDEEEPAV